MRRIIAITLLAVAALAFVATLISLLPTDFWLVREGDWTVVCEGGGCAGSD